MLKELFALPPKPKGCVHCMAEAANRYNETVSDQAILRAAIKLLARIEEERPPDIRAWWMGKASRPCGHPRITEEEMDTRMEYLMAQKAKLDRYGVSAQLLLSEMRQHWRLAH